MWSILIGLLILAWWAIATTSRHNHGLQPRQKYVTPADVLRLLNDDKMSSHNITEQMTLQKHGIVYEFATEHRGVVLTYTHKTHDNLEKETLTLRAHKMPGFIVHFSDGRVESMKYGAEITRHTEDLQLKETGELLTLLLTVRRKLHERGEMLPKIASA